MFDARKGQITITRGDTGLLAIVPTGYVPTSQDRMFFMVAEMPDGRIVINKTVTPDDDGVCKLMFSGTDTENLSKRHRAYTYAIRFALDVTESNGKITGYREMITPEPPGCFVVLEANGCPACTCETPNVGSMEVKIESFRGPKGDKGETGPIGPQGPKGEKGDKGDRGEKGDTGPQGETGAKGDAFTFGDFTPEQLESLRGPKGDTGATGPQGTEGAVGPQGPQGAKGEPGKDAVIDATLTQEGAAADAKATGDAISQLKEDIANVAIGDIGELDNIDLSDKEVTLQGYYMYNDGIFVSAENFAATNKIPVVEGQKFIVTLERIWNNSGISEFSADSSFVGSPLGTEYIEKSEVIQNYEYTVPNGVSHVSFSSLNDTRLIIMKKPYTAIDNIFAVNKKVDNMDTATLFSAMYDKYIPFVADFANDGYMQKNGSINGKGEDYRHAMIPVTVGEKYKISGRGYYNCTLYTFIGEHGTITFFPSDTTGITDANLILFEAQENGTLYVNYSGDTDYAVEILKLDGYKTEKNILDNKVILFTGDSICQASVQNEDGSYTGDKYGWAEIIKENNADTVIRNYGIGGTTFAVREGRNDSIYERISTMKERFPKCDYIVIEGGVNDYYNRETEHIGEMTDHYNGAYDISTFAGALEQIFYDVNKKWNGIKIGFIVTFKTSDVSEWDTYMTLAKKICEKWAIPYIDLFNHGRLNFRIEQMKKDYSYLQGGLHPNIDGYRIITPMIENWLKSI